jgi:hypothetical protein
VITSQSYLAIACPTLEQGEVFIHTLELTISVFIKLNKKFIYIMDKNISN